MIGSEDWGGESDEDSSRAQQGRPKAMGYDNVIVLKQEYGEAIVSQSLVSLSRFSSVCRSLEICVQGGKGKYRGLCCRACLILDI